MLNEKWKDFIKFTSIKKYIENLYNKSIDTIYREVTLSHHLRGIELFIEYVNIFETPDDIITNKKETIEFIENFPEFLEKKQLKEATIKGYIYRLIQFLKYNNVIVKENNSEDYKGFIGFNIDPKIKQELIREILINPLKPTLTQLILFKLRNFNELKKITNILTDSIEKNKLSKLLNSEQILIIKNI